MILFISCHSYFYLSQKNEEIFIKWIVLKFSKSVDSWSYMEIIKINSDYW